MIFSNKTYFFWMMNIVRVLQKHSQIFQAHLKNYILAVGVHFCSLQPPSRNKALLGPYFKGWVALGDDVPLDSHENQPSCTSPDLP